MKLEAELGERRKEAGDWGAIQGRKQTSHRRCKLRQLALQTLPKRHCLLGADLAQGPREPIEKLQRSTEC
jgi:hypothetical protein